MSITIKKIAEISGVSRGTVDRVLNNRGKVSPDKEKKVRECANALGYTPNIAGKTLAVSKKNHIVGIILNSEQNIFFDDVIEEIHKQISHFNTYGIKVIFKTMKGYDTAEQLKHICDLPEQLTGLIITPVDDKQIIEKLNELAEKNVCVITLNNDVKNCKRMCYVGPDYYDGGKISAGVVKLIKPSGAIIGVVQGSRKLYGHGKRLLGFNNELCEKYKVHTVCECQDDDILAYLETTKMLADCKDIDTIFIVAGGVYGVCRAIKEANRQICVVCFDDTQVTIELLKEGLIKAIVSQGARLQGKKAMQIMFDYFVKNEIPNEFIVQNQIKIKQNYI